ncbi:MAG: riboflavin biosynthesis protein RibF [Bacteroidales bacterium]|nr:riboflavin biosynthesis protein RibF [Bacteroidales bacterium]
MAIYTDISHPDLAAGAGVVTIGSFDGVHCGHQALLRQVAALAGQRRYRSTVITFATHPRMLLDSSTPKRWLLNTPDEKNELLAKTGIDDIVVLPFDWEMSQMTANEFVQKIILGKLNAKYWVVGEDHSFGRNRDGNAENIVSMMDVQQIQIVKVNLMKCEYLSLNKDEHPFAEKISSSAIRTLLQKGELDTANKMLGYEYSLSGKVMPGNQIGRSIGFPTANIEPHADKLLPKNGVYGVRIDLDGDRFYGMTYIGKRTVVRDSDDIPHVETHIFDFKRDIYGKILRLSFMYRIRNDSRFDNMEQLQARLQLDELQIREKIAACKPF